MLNNKPYMNFYSDKNFDLLIFIIGKQTNKIV